MKKLKKQHKKEINKQDKSCFSLQIINNMIELIKKDIIIMEKFITKKGKLVKYIGSEEIVKLPYRVKGIKELAFFSHDTMKEIIFTKYVEEIDEGVFDFALELENIIVRKDNPVFKSIDGCLYNKELDTLIKYPANKDSNVYKVLETVKTINKDALTCTMNLTEVILPEGLKEIKSAAFQDCQNLAKIILPKSLEIIENHAFFGCESLKELIIPENVKEIGNYAFYGCNGLEKIIFLGKPKVNDFSLTGLENVEIIKK